MNEKLFFTSVTRISDLRDAPFEVRSISREEWEMGDYVVTEVTESLSRRIVELSTGRVIEVAEGDMLVGAFGRREATLEATGDWSRIGEDGACEIPVPRPPDPPGGEGDDARIRARLRAAAV
jgi:hypothetical protein